MDSYYVHLETIIRDFEAVVYERGDFWEPWDRDSLDWIVVTYKKNNYIGVNDMLSEYEKASVCMHEVWHIATGTVGVVWSLLCERMCDDWALEQMIPEEKVREAIDEYWYDTDFLCPLFGCSREHVEKRCKKLSIF
jgi:Zn-dependent peptidase ImmA (M78 family)